MFGAIALGALWRPLELIYFLMCKKWVFGWISKNVQNYFKINGLERFQGTHLGGPISAKSVPMQRGARFRVFRSVPMQHGVNSGARNLAKIKVLERGTRLGDPQGRAPGDRAFGFVAPQGEAGGWVVITRHHDVASTRYQDRIFPASLPALVLNLKRP